MSINAYYGLLFGIVAILTVPVFWLKELDATNIPQHTGAHFFAEIWDTLKNLTTFYLIIYVIGIQGFTNFTSNANIQLQYYVIKLTNFQAGIDTVTTYSALVLAIWLFQRYMINRDWHLTQYASVLIAAGLGLVWIAPFYNSGGTQDPWFTIFIDLDTVIALFVLCQLMHNCLNFPTVFPFGAVLRPGLVAGSLQHGGDRAGQARTGGHHL